MADEGTSEGNVVKSGKNLLVIVDMSDATTSPSYGEPTTPRSTMTADTGEPFVDDREHSES